MSKKIADEHTTLTGDDDDPVNDPEYIAAEKIPVDAEELRDVNISKKELTELVAELFEGLLNEGVCMESIELETPKKFLENSKFESPKSDNGDNSSVLQYANNMPAELSTTSSHFNQTDLSFHPATMSTPQLHVQTRNFAEEIMPEKINPLPAEQPNYAPGGEYCNAFEVSYSDPATTANRVIYVPHTPVAIPVTDQKVENFPQWAGDRYIPARKLLKYEYVNKFEKLKHNSQSVESNLSDEPTGFTLNQYQILQQQLRIHVQFLAQNFFQTYSHPDLWKIAPQQKRMLVELDTMAQENATFNAWNLQPALQLIKEWELELEGDTEENARMMKFIFKEMRRVSKTHNQVARFSPRIMKRILGSSVFMYPQYLPRIPFAAHQISFHMFAPAEAFLIAMGLEKHLNNILANELHFSYLKRRTPLSVACERIANTFIHGKTPRRLKDHIKELTKSSTYNPVQYYYENKKAPPADHTIVPIDLTNVLPPGQRLADLPLVWKDFLQVLNAGGIINNSYPENYSRYIKEITGEQIDFPSAALRNRSVKWAQKEANKEKENQQPSVTININYLFGQAIEHSDFTENPTPRLLDLGETQNTNLSVTVSPLKSTSNTSGNSESQKKQTNCCVVHPKETGSTKKVVARPKVRWRSGLRLRKYSSSYFTRKLKQTAKRFRSVKNLQKRYENLLSVYRLNLDKQFAKFKNLTLRFVFRHCKALELYTNLLRDLKMNCRKMKAGDEIVNRRKMSEDQDIPKSRRTNRQEENLRHMLLPDTAEDANRKDAIYAFNFYEKVEEVLKQSSRPEDCKKFNHILRAFDPKVDKVADLYYKLEQLFLPDHPELAQVFLTFLLPPEAAEIGKFFEHFMYTNAGTFFNKLNVYFNKQPAQIRKIFNCLSELSEDPDVTMEKLKSKIFPLLKGNTFLIDWFTQLFLSEPPPERLYGAAENTNMKEILVNQSGDYVETMHPNDLLDSPTESQTCQLKYINGRIFYGNKIPLPAKLSFMASSYQADELNEPTNDDGTSSAIGGCVHGIKEYGEKRLTAASMNDCSSDDNEKSEEEESKDVIVPPSLDEEQFETCDDATLRAHAVRLNPSYYATSCYSTSVTSAPTCHKPVKPSATVTEDGKAGSPRKAMTKPNPPTSTVTSASSSTTSSSSSSSSSSSIHLFKERRRSPKKGFMRSPLSVGKRYLADNSSRSNAIAAAKKLKNLIDDDSTPLDSDASKRRLAKRRKVGDLNPENDETDGSDDEVELSPKKEIKQEPVQPWTRDEDKIILEEIKSGFKNQILYERINSKMLNRSLSEIEERHTFLMDFLSKLHSAK